MKNRHILEQLEDVLRHPEKRLHKIFGFTVFNQGELKEVRGIPNCGTVGCAAGELPGIDPDWYFDEDGDLYYGQCEAFSALMYYFHLDLNAIGHLFHPYQQDPDRYGGKVLGDDATPEEVADNMREFLKRVE